MRRQLRIESVLSWIVAWLLVIAAVGMAIVFDAAAWTWWVGMALFVPLIIALITWRAEQKGDLDTSYTLGDGGPWGPRA